MLCVLTIRQITNFLPNFRKRCFLSGHTKIKPNGSRIGNPKHLRAAINDFADHRFAFDNSSRQWSYHHNQIVTVLRFELLGAQSANSVFRLFRLQCTKCFQIDRQTKIAERSNGFLDKRCCLLKLSLTFQ